MPTEARHMRCFTGSGRLVDPKQFRRREGSVD